MAKPTKRNSRRHLEAVKGKTKKNAILEGLYFAVMSGTGYTYITPFAIALGVPNFVVGLLSAFATLASFLGQHLGAWILQFEKSRRDFVVRLRFAQAAIWIPISLLFLLSPDLSSVGLIILYSGVIFTGTFTSPAWTSLLGDALTKKDRGYYLGHRNRLMVFVDLISAILAGAILFLFTNNVFVGFLIIFGVAAAMRFVSGRYASKVWDPPFRAAKESFGNVFRIPKNIHFRNFLTLWSGIRFASDIGGPFFAVYLLRNLGFDYLSFGVVIAAWAIGSMFSQPFWGRIIDKYGTRPVVFATIALNPLIPAAFIFVFNPASAMLVYFLGGVVWAGLNLGITNFLFRISSRKQLPEYSASLRGISSIVAFAGAAIGSALVFLMEGATLF